MSAKRKPCGIGVVIIGYAENLNEQGKTGNFSFSLVCHCRKYGFLQRAYVILRIPCYCEERMQKKPYYSPEEVAEYYDVTADTIRRLCREGKIPGAKQIGKQWRIPAKFLEDTPSIQETDEDTKDQ